MVDKIIYKGDRVARHDNNAQGTVLGVQTFTWEDGERVAVYRVQFDHSQVGPGVVLGTEITYVEPEPANVEKPFMLFAWDSDMPLGGTGGFVDAFEEPSPKRLECTCKSQCKVLSCGGKP